MIKILYLITDLDAGGAELTLLHLATRLNRTCFDCSVACLSGRGDLARRFQERGIPVHFLDVKSKLDLTAVFRLCSLLNSNNYDILHSFLFHANIAGRTAALLANRRPFVVASIRVAEPRRHHLWLEGWTSGLVDQFVAVSEGVRALMVDRAKIPPHKIIAIPNGVDPADTPQNPPDVRGECGLPPGCPVIVTVGRLTRQKGHTFLVRAAERVLKTWPDAQFLFVGDGPLRRTLAHQAQRLGIAANIHFLGWRADARRILASADLFVLPSLWEGMPNALLEAMAAGLPVIATYVAGSSEVVEDGQSGILVPPQDDRILGQAIMGLLSNRERARALGEAGRQRVLAHYSMERMVIAHETLYREVMERKRRIAELAQPEQNLALS